MAHSNKLEWCEWPPKPRHRWKSSTYRSPKGPLGFHESFAEKFVHESSQDVFKDVTGHTRALYSPIVTRKINEQDKMFGGTVVRIPRRDATLVCRVAGGVALRFQLRRWCGPLPYRNPGSAHTRSGTTRVEECLKFEVRVAQMGESRTHLFPR